MHCKYKSHEEMAQGRNILKDFWIYLENKQDRLLGLAYVKSYL